MEYADTAQGSFAAQEKAAYLASGQVHGLVRPPYAGGPGLTKDMPLTVAIKDATSNHIQAATRAYHTLSELRDRLIGAPAPSPMGTDGRNAEPYSFSDAIHGANSELGQRLAMLEALAQELSGRL